ncbi:unnamed protein product [Boreogadus saida]
MKTEASSTQPLKWCEMQTFYSSFTYKGSSGGRLGDDEAELKVNPVPRGGRVPPPLQPSTMASLQHSCPSTMASLQHSGPSTMASLQHSGPSTMTSLQHSGPSTMPSLQHSGLSQRSALSS